MLLICMGLLSEFLTVSMLHRIGPSTLELDH